jgi:hypothetical protein
MILYKVVVKIVRSKLKLGRVNNSSQNSQILSLINIWLPVLQLIRACWKTITSYVTSAVQECTLPQHTLP